ncbi:MAG: L,D-transpeptidase [Pseudomonadota bacterium]|nr:L,D-transpeptidase [Pseudomonadota bacterium]
MRLTLVLTAAAAMAAIPLAPSTAQTAPAVDVPADAPPGLFSGERTSEILTVQILLDRAKHSPGAIDGMMGGNTRRAISAYQRANGMPVTGEPDAALLQSLEGGSSDFLKRYRITEEDVAGPFLSVPSDFAAKAEIEKPTFESPAEGLAEKFHMAESFLQALNPGADFGSAGSEILVINAGPDELNSKVSRIEVDKAANELRAYSADGGLVATYPTTVGSSIHPSPNTKLEVLAIASDPTYHFDPEDRSWGPDHEFTIAAGPNNPVGTVWIDLSQDGYGIHGTPDPELIGKTSSHGCVRLTNWDAAELSKVVSKGTTVTFV